MAKGIQSGVAPNGIQQARLRQPMAVSFQIAGEAFLHNFPGQIAVSGKPDQVGKKTFSVLLIETPEGFHVNCTTLISSDGYKICW
jgi:hypothetical protein